MINPRDKSLEEHHDNICDPFGTVIFSNNSSKFQANKNLYAEIRPSPSGESKKSWIY